MRELGGFLAVRTLRQHPDETERKKKEKSTEEERQRLRLVYRSLRPRNGSSPSSRQWRAVKLQLPIGSCDEAGRCQL